MLGEKKKRYLILTVFAVLVLGLIILSSMLLWGGNTLVFKVNTPSSVVEKLRTVEKSGGNVEINEADLNALLQLQFKDKNQPAGIQLDGIYAKVTESRLRMYVPARYHGLSFLVSTAGELTYQEGNLVFKPDFIQVGKLKLPFKWVMKELSSRSIAGLVVKENNTIEISKEILPFTIKTLALNGDKLILDFEKAVQTQQATEQNASGGQSTQSSSSSGSSTSSRVDLLRRAKSQLSSVYGAVRTQEEKNVIGQIQAVVGKMVDNPSYAYSAESQQVKEQYNRLTAEEKSDVKDAILMNMDTGTLREIKGTFGL